MYRLVLGGVLNILMVKLEGFRDFQELKIRTVRIIQHDYKRHLDLLHLREKERVAGWQLLLQTKVKVLSVRSSQPRMKNARSGSRRLSLTPR